MLDLKDLLSSLVSLESTLGKERSVAEWLDWLLQRNGFQTQKQQVSDGRFNIYAERGSGSKLMWYGHIDTVPVYEGWDTDPLKLTIKGDRFYGLGVCDMKGGIAALLDAVVNWDLSTPTKLLFCIDEEYDSDGAWTVHKKHTDIFDGVEYLISMEPGASKERIGGSDVITLGRRGRVRLEVKVTGLSAHGGHPERGLNAIDISTRLITRINAMRLPKHELLGRATHYVLNISSSTTGLSLPEQCYFEIDRHLVAGETIESALKDYNAVIDDELNAMRSNDKSEMSNQIKVRVAVKKRKNEYALPYLTPTSQFVEQIQQAMRKENGSVSINYGRSVGDENIFSQIKNVKPIIIGPEGGNIHSRNEWVDIKSLERCSVLYKEILKLSQSL